MCRETTTRGRLSGIEHHRFLATSLVFNGRGIRLQRPVIMPRRLGPGRLGVFVAVRHFGGPRPVSERLLLLLLLLLLWMLHVDKFLKPSVVRMVTAVAVMVVDVIVDAANVTVMLVLARLTGFEVTRVIQTNTARCRVVVCGRLLYGRRSRQRFWRARFLLLNQRARARRRSDLDTINNDFIKASYADFTQIMNGDVNLYRYARRTYYYRKIEIWKEVNLVFSYTKNIFFFTAGKKRSIGSYYIYIYISRIKPRT